MEIACGALPENLLESELFGHVAGSFTGAIGNKQGKFKLADGGTIFLDEIATASPSLQIKLLRVLQNFEFEQVGGSETHKVNTRVILATNEDMTAAVTEGRFREDLFYRINVINLQLPPLRHRQNDVMTLAEHFLSKFNSEIGRSIFGFETAAGPTRFNITDGPVMFVNYKTSSSARCCWASPARSLSMTCLPI